MKKIKNYILISVIVISLIICLYIVLENYNKEKIREKEQDKTNKIFCEYLDISIMEKVKNATDSQIFVEYQNASIKLEKASAMLDKTSYVSNKDAKGAMDSFVFSSTLKFLSNSLKRQIDANEKIPEDILIDMDEILKNIVININNEARRTKYFSKLDALLERINK